MKLEGGLVEREEGSSVVNLADMREYGKYRFHIKHDITNTWTLDSKNSLSVCHVYVFTI